MPGKEDPLEQSRRAPRALWLASENMQQARHNYFKAWMEQSDLPISSPGQVAALSAQWEMAWAAAIAVHSYVWEGRTEPR